MFLMYLYIKILKNYQLNDIYNVIYDSTKKYYCVFFLQDKTKNLCGNYVII